MPPAIASSTNTAAPERKLVMAALLAERAIESRFLDIQVVGDRLPDIETMNQNAAVAVEARRKRAWQQACDGTERVAFQPRLEVRFETDKARPQRQTRIDRAPRHVKSRDERAVQQ